jgi:hypothetical protein
MTTKNELFEIIGLYCLECCSGNESQVKECDGSRYASSEGDRCAYWGFRLGADPLVSGTEDLDEPET